MESEEKSFDLQGVVHEPLEDLPEKGQRMGQASIRSHGGFRSEISFYINSLYIKSLY